jgi:hypothetical protein
LTTDRSAPRALLTLQAAPIPVAALTAPQEEHPMLTRTRIALGALATIAVAGGTAGAAAAQASAHGPGQLTIVSQLTAIRFFSNSGPIKGWPTKPLVPGDRIIGQDRILQNGKPAGHDNEVCTLSFHRDVLCQDIVVLNGQGDLQASWTLQWPTGHRGPSHFDGVIDGGTSRFAAAHGSFRAVTLHNGDLRITAVINADRR